MTQAECISYSDEEIKNGVVDNDWVVAMRYGTAQVLDHMPLSTLAHHVSRQIDTEVDSIDYLSFHFL